MESPIPDWENQELETAVPKAAEPGPTVHIEASALAMLEGRVHEATISSNGRGLEIGGLILGSRSGSELRATAFLPVAIAYRFGNAYRPSHFDIATLRRNCPAIGAEHGAEPVGYFRSQLRGGSSLRPEDYHAISGLYPHVDSCFVLIRTGIREAGSVEVYGVKARENPALFQRFPLQPRSVEPAPGNSPSPNDLPAPRVPQTQAPEPPAFRGLRSKVALWSIAALSVAVLVAGAAYLLGRRSIPPPAPRHTVQVAGTRLSLQITERGAQLMDIRWNASYPSIRTAVKGTLILTGDASGDIELHPAQMSSGLYTFKTAAKAVHVLFVIYQADGSFIGDMQDFRRTPEANQRDSPPDLSPADLPLREVSSPPPSPQPSKVTPRKPTRRRSRNPLRKTR